MYDAMLFMAREGMIPPERFFNPENMERLVGTAPPAA